MGTRGFISFVVDDIEKTAYNHNDSYPDGLGLDVLRWLRKAHEAGSRRMARELRVVEPNSKPTAEDIERLRPYADLGVSTQKLDDWYVLLRHSQGDPAAMLDAGVIEDASEFPADSLFAEWGYVVDFDGRLFEVHKGFQDAPLSSGRFASRPPNPRSGYYPVALVRAWDFDSLPTDAEFIAAVDPEDES
jgi:hypothetical protein